MSGNSDNLQPLKQFRLLAVRLTLLATVVVSTIAWFFNPITAQGVLLGGLAGVLGFWIIAIRLEKVVRLNPEKVHFATLTWSFYRFAMYGAVLYKTFTLDRVYPYYGMIGGLIGIMMIRFVLVIVGATGMDQRLWKNAAKNDENTEEPEENSDE